MNSELYDRLVAAGLAESEAEEIAKAHPVAGSDEAEIDVDRLTKAMQDVATSFSNEDDSTSAVEDVVAEATSIVDAVTKGADALLAEQREQYEALSKGFLALAEEVKELRTAVSAAPAETIAKAVPAPELSHDEPALRKSIEVVPAPGDVSDEGLTHSSLISKALAELQSDSDISTNRQADLRKAVSLLESGAIPAEVSATYRL